MSAPATERATTRNTAKFEARRAELAASALDTLAQTGYANTSLRDIAHNADFSHGVLHYYFEDKLDLIIYCVRRYKADCVRRYDAVLAGATTPEELRRDFVRLLGETLVHDAAYHRLWYDLRAQSLFEPALRRDAAEIDRTLESMIWRIVSRYAELAGRQVVASEGFAYALFDGLFQRALLNLADEEGAAAATLRAEAARALDRLVSG